MKKSKFTKGEYVVIGIMIAATADLMKSATVTTQRNYASLSKKVMVATASDAPGTKVKKAKPLSKKAVKEILKKVMPEKTVTDKGEFLSKLQQNINQAFN